MNYIKFDINNKDSLKKVVFLYILIQPFLSYWFLFTDQIIPGLSISPATIIRVFGFMYICLLFFINCENKNKLLKYLLIYSLLITTYLLFHVYGAIKINFLPEHFPFSLKDELYYLFRMNIPIFLFIIILNLKFKKEEFRSMIFLLSLIVSLTIVLTNFSNLSLVSYSDKFQIINMNFFKWFSFSNGGHNFIGMTSKGLFVYGNEIGNVLLLLLPYNLYFYYKYGDVKYLISSISVLLSMLMTGTRTSFFGTYLSFFVILGYLVISFVFRKKQIDYNRILKILLILYFHIIVSLFSPIALRYNWVAFIYKNLNFSVLYLLNFIIFCFSYIYNVSKKKNIRYSLIIFIMMLLLLSLFETFVDKRHNLQTVQGSGKTEVQIVDNKKYEKMYPEDFDNEFWNNLGDYDSWRQVQEKIFERIMWRATQEKGNFYPLLGLSYSRFKNGTEYEFYLEKDIVIHYYTLGLVGILMFILPYILFTIYGSYLFLKERKKYFKLEKFVSVASVMLVIFSSYFGGYVFDSMFAMIIMVLVISFFFCENVGGVKNDSKS